MLKLYSYHKKQIQEILKGEKKLNEKIKLLENENLLMKNGKKAMTQEIKEENIILKDTINTFRDDLENVVSFKNNLRTLKRKTF